MKAKAIRVCFAALWLTTVLVMFAVFGNLRLVDGVALVLAYGLMIAVLMGILAVSIPRVFGLPKGARGTQAHLRLLLKVFAGAFFLAFQVFFLQAIFFYRARIEVRDRLNGLDRSQLSVFVAGAESPRPQTMLDTVLTFRRMGRWRKQIREDTEFVFTDGEQEVVLVIGRGGWHEYWIHYPRYTSTAGNSFAAFYYAGPNLYEDALQPPPDAVEAAALPTNASAEEATNEDDSPACGLNATADAEQD